MAVFVIRACQHFSRVSLSGDAVSGKPRSLQPLPFRKSDATSQVLQGLVQAASADKLTR